MKQNKLSFESENLQVDYLTFNIQGTPDFDLVNRIAKYLFQHFDFNSIISNCSKNKKHLFFSDKNRHQVEFAVYLRAPELNSFWDGTQIRFSGKNAIRFYQLIQQQKINWHLFKTQNFKLAKLNKFTLNRVDLCYSKTKKDINTIQSFEFFLNSCHEKILQNSRTKHIKYSRNKKGFILKVGSRKSPNYYRVYENNQEIRFESTIYLEKSKTADMEAIVAIVDNKSGRLKLSSTITAEEYQNLINKKNLDLELTDLRRDPQTGVRNVKSVKEANTMERAKEQGLVESYRRPKVYLGETDVDFVNLNGSKKYELKAVTQNERKSYQDSAKDIIKNIQNQAEKMKVGETLPDYLIDLEGVPDSLKWNIAQNIQDQLQSINNLDELNFVY